MKMPPLQKIRRGGSPSLSQGQGGTNGAFSDARRRLRAMLRPWWWSEAGRRARWTGERRRLGKSSSYSSSVLQGQMWTNSGHLEGRDEFFLWLKTRKGREKQKAKYLFRLLFFYVGFQQLDCRLFFFFFFFFLLPTWTKCQRRVSNRDEEPSTDGERRVNNGDEEPSVKQSVPTNEAHWYKEESKKEIFIYLFIYLFM